MKLPSWRLLLIALRVSRRLRQLARPVLAPIKLILWRPLLGALRDSDRRAGLILLYHEVGDRDGDPRRELVPAISRVRLARQLAHLQRHYRLVELPDLPSAVAARRRGEPFPVALTFDDDRGHHATHALPELREAEAPATFFLCGSFLEDEPRDFWWQRLQRAVDGGAELAPLLGSGTIHQLGQVMEALSPEQRDAVADELECLTSAVPAGEVLTAQEARRLPHIGFHTLRHDTLTSLDDERLAHALVDGRAGLAEVAGYPVDIIAYPHGTFDSRVVEAARKSDFAMGLTCEEEAVTPDSNLLALGRYEPPAGALTGEFALDLVRILIRSH
ncbi:MAG: polysaccharide deacetylase family protein [Actinomycetia bacterium]|nr:polysaccharide deacetylase family protein [Actinomycetes bacterium]